LWAIKCQYSSFIDIAFVWVDGVKVSNTEAADAVIDAACRHLRLPTLRSQSSERADAADPLAHAGR